MSKQAPQVKRSEPTRQKELIKPILIVSSSDEQEQVREICEIASVSKSSLVDMQTCSEGALVPFRRREDATYIRPSKFVPVLDYFSTSDKEGGCDSEGGIIKPTWKPQEGEHDPLSTWRKVKYDIPSGPSTRRRDSLGSLMDRSMQEMNKQFKANISQLSQGLCYNKMDRNIQSDLSGAVSSTTSKETGETKPLCHDRGQKSSVEDTNPLIYFKYDFGYEFGIANPRSERASSEPPSKKCLPTSASSVGGTGERPTSWMAHGVDEQEATISLPIIHETTSTKK